MERGAYFRAGVGAVVINAEGLVLALERSDVPGAWQVPQGGIQGDEEPVEAIRRELLEETGIPWNAVTVVAEYPRWLAYELPTDTWTHKTGRGQVQRWFLLRFGGDDDAIDLSAAGDDREFTTWRWLPMAQLIDATWPVRRPVYRALASEWALLLRNAEPTE